MNNNENGINNSSSSIVVENATTTSTTSVDRSHTVLVLNAPSGVGVNLIVSIRVGEQSSSKTILSESNSFSYLPPHIFSIVPNVLSTLACVRFESPFEWEQRVSKDFTQADRISQVVGTGPKCLEPSVLEIKGMSLGKSKATL